MPSQRNQRRSTTRLPAHNPGAIPHAENVSINICECLNVAPPQNRRVSCNTDPPKPLPFPADFPFFMQWNFPFLIISLMYKIEIIFRGTMVCATACRALSTPDIRKTQNIKYNPDQKDPMGRGVPEKNAKSHTRG